MFTILKFLCHKNLLVFIIFLWAGKSFGSSSDFSQQDLDALNAMPISIIKTFAQNGLDDAEVNALLGGTGTTAERAQYILDQLGGGYTNITSAISGIQTLLGNRSNPYNIDIITGLTTAQSTTSPSRTILGGANYILNDQLALWSYGTNSEAVLSTFWGQWNGYFDGHTSGPNNVVISIPLRALPFQSPLFSSLGNIAQSFSAASFSSN